MSVSHFNSCALIVKAPKTKNKVKTIFFIILNFSSNIAKSMPILNSIILHLALIF